MMVILDDDGLGVAPELGLLGRRELLARVDDDRQILDGGVVLDALEQREAAHVGEPQIEHHAVEAPLGDLLQGRLGGGDRRDLDVLAPAHQLDDAAALHLVVFDHEQVAHRLLDEAGDPVEGAVERVGADRLLQVRDRALAQPALPLVHARHDVHGDVARGGVVLELVEHGPAVDPRQRDVERDRVRPVLLGELERGLPVGGDEGLESLVARHAHQHAREVDVVFDDHDDAVPRLDGAAIVVHRGLGFGERDLPPCTAAPVRAGARQVGSGSLRGSLASGSGAAASRAGPAYRSGT
jgi:hypothetical protein